MCSYTEPVSEPGLDNFSLFLHFHPLQVTWPLSGGFSWQSWKVRVRFKDRVSVTVRVMFIYLFIFVYKYFASRKIRKGLTRVLARVLAWIPGPSPGFDVSLSHAWLIISEHGVLKQLSSLNPIKAFGPEQIPSWFLKDYAAEIAAILTDIFQDSIDSGTVPCRWKEANMCAVFKKGKLEIWPSQL